MVADGGPDTTEPQAPEQARYADAGSLFRAFMEEKAEVVAAMRAGDLKPLEAKRQLEVLRESYETDCLLIFRMTLEDAARWDSDPIRNLTSVMERDAGELARLREAILRIDKVREDIKKNWLQLIDDVKEIQEQARNDPVKGMVYVLRDANEERVGQMLQVQWFQVRFFDCWTDGSHPNSLVMAHPGTAKTTCMRWLIVHELGHKPNLRCLLLYDKKERAAQEGQTIKSVIQSPRYRALFPDIRIQGHAENEANQSAMFTVFRPNWYAREASVEATGIQCNVNGQGYDRVYADDICAPRVRDEIVLRNKIVNIWYTVIKRRLRDPAHARIRMICTPWHPDDLPGRIRRQAAAGEAPTWVVGADEFSIREDANGNPIPIWPELFGADYLREARWEDPQGYRMNYQLDASNVQRRAVRWVRYYNSTGELEWGNDAAVREGLLKCERTLSIDPAGSDGIAACDTGIIDGAISPGGYGFVRNFWSLHVNSTEMIGWIANRLRDAWKLENHPYTTVLIEAQGGMKGIATVVEDLIPKILREMGMPQECIPAVFAPGANVGQDGGRGRSKMRRLRAAAPYIENGIVFFAGRRMPGLSHGLGAGDGKMSRVRSIPGSEVERLAQYILDFDGTNRADGVDATTQFILFNAHRLHREYGDQPKAAVRALPTDPISLAYRAAIRAMEEGIRQSRTAWDEEQAFFAARERRVA